MALRLLLDEDTAAALATTLDERGHEVERIVDELGRGVTDDAICRYATRTERIVLTHDADFVGRPVDDHAGVFYVPDQRLSPHEVARIVDAVAASYPEGESMQSVVFLVDDWL